MEWKFMKRYYKFGPLKVSLGTDRHKPGKPADHKWHGVRAFWAKSLGGRHLADYEGGVAAGKAELGSGDFLYLDSLRSVEVSARDDVWQARLDGYVDATRDLRGAVHL
jgi:hypothetical protein